MVRPPAVAGQFYRYDPQQLRGEVNLFPAPAAGQHPAIGILCPHAGYPYSGPTAGMVFSHTEIPSRMILLGVNHHGIGSPFAVFARGQWMTPLGAVDIDEPFASRLLATCGLLCDD